MTKVHVIVDNEIGMDVNVDVSSFDELCEPNMEMWKSDHIILKEVKQKLEEICAKLESGDKVSVMAYPSQGELIR